MNIADLLRNVGKGIATGVVAVALTAACAGAEIKPKGYEVRILPDEQMKDGTIVRCVEVVGNNYDMAGRVANARIRERVGNNFPEQFISSKQEAVGGYSVKITACAEITPELYEVQ